MVRLAIPRGALPQTAKLGSQRGRKLQHTKHMDRAHEVDLVELTRTLARHPGHVVPVTQATQSPSPRHTVPVTQAHGPRHPDHTVRVGSSRDGALWTGPGTTYRH